MRIILLLALALVGCDRPGSASSSSASPPSIAAFDTFAKSFAKAIGDRDQAGHDDEVHVAMVASTDIKKTDSVVNPYVAETTINKSDVTRSGVTKTTYNFTFAQTDGKWKMVKGTAQDGRREETIGQNDFADLIASVQR